MSDEQYIIKRNKILFNEILLAYSYRMFVEYSLDCAYTFCIGLKEWENSEIKERGFIIQGNDDSIYEWAISTLLSTKPLC